MPTNTRGKDRINVFHSKRNSIETTYQTFAVRDWEMGKNLMTRTKFTGPASIIMCCCRTQEENALYCKLIVFHDFAENTNSIISYFFNYKLLKCIDVYILSKMGHNAILIPLPPCIFPLYIFLHIIELQKSGRSRESME